MFLAKKDAPGRLGGLAPIAIVDIGSNSVRLVAYEGLSRSPTPIFNDKVLCGLGRGVATTGRLPQDGVDRALAALRSQGRTRLFSVDLASGRATPIGTVGDGRALWGMAIAP
jgi:hypothetical protein